MYVNKVRSNVKKGVELDLHRRTLIIGPNGAGKSSLINSLELALGGFASDVLGKGIVKQASDLMNLSHDGKKLESEVEVITDSSGTAATCTWSTTATSRSVKRPIHKTPITAHFPFIEVEENLVGSAEKVRKWILAHVSEATEREVILETLRKGVRDNYSKVADALKSSKPHLSEIDLVLEVGQQQAAFAREKKKEIKVLDNSAQGWAASLGAKPTEEELAESLKEEQEAFKAFSDFKAQHESSVKITSARIGAVLSQAKRLASSLQEKEAKKTKLDPLNIQDLTESEQKLRTVGVYLKGIVDHAPNRHTCPVCYREVDLDVKRQQLEAAFKVLEDKHKIASLYSDLKGQIQALRQQTVETMEEWKRLSSSQAKEEVVAQLEALEKVHTEALEKRINLQHTERGWKELEDLQARLEERQKEEKNARALATQCKSACKKLLSKCVSDFSEKVSAFLPEGDTFELRTDSAGEKCSFGLVRDGKHLTALSGAEWVRVVLAISCVTSSSDSFNVFIPRERAIDDENLKLMMEALKDAPGQVILTALAPLEEYPADWMVIDLVNNTKQLTKQGKGAA